jgi:hypothetical protein
VMVARERDQGGVALHPTTLGCRKPLGGLAILGACCFVGAAGRVAGAVRMSAGAR